MKGLDLHFHMWKDSDKKDSWIIKLEEIGMPYLWFGTFQKST